jgi:myosin-crossreactive antigen
MDQKEQMQLLDELMSTIQIMDELYRYHPENPNPSRCGIRIQGVGRTQSRNRSQTGLIRHAREELINHSSLRTLRETLKNKPGTIEDAF